MAFTLHTVVPWGRSFREYERMFALTATDLAGTMLGCADGPASFNAEATGRNLHVVSCDPLYRCRRPEIQQRIEATYAEMIEQTRKNHAAFVWQEFQSADDVGRARMQAMQSFLDDYESGLEQGRYVADELPALSFGDRSFDLALCSHFLFLYTQQLSEEFHLQAAAEMSRVAREVRIFPLLALDGRPSPFVNSVSGHLRGMGLEVSQERVPYEFVRGANQMLRVRRHED